MTDARGFRTVLCAMVLGALAGQTLADTPVIDLTNVGNEYVQGSGETVYFRTHYMSPYEVLIFEARPAGDPPGPVFEEFTGVVGAYRGGLRFIPATSLDKLPKGVWNLRIYSLANSHEATKVVAVVDAKPEEKEEEEYQRIELEAEQEAVEEPAAEETPTQLPPLWGDLPPSKGFTDFKTSADSRVIFVPSGGNIQSGYDQIRDGYPDFLLLEAGGRYTLNGPLVLTKSGRSSNEPMVFGVIGQGPRPVINSPKGFIRTTGRVRDVAVVGMHAVPFHRDPGRQPVSQDAVRETIVGLDLAGNIENVRIEDCLVEYFSWNVIASSPGTATNVFFHRCIIRRSFRHHDVGHSSGMFAGAGLNGFYVTESLWDHNGWDPRVSGAGRRMFNHGAYLWGTKNVHFENCIISRSSNNGLNLRTGYNSTELQNNIRVRGTMFFGSPNGIALGTMSTSAISRNLSITDNVFARMGGDLGEVSASTGFSMHGFDGFELRRNLFIDTNTNYPSFCFALEPYFAQVSNGQVQDNIAFNWKSDGHFRIRGTNVSNVNNRVESNPALLLNASRTIATFLATHGRSGGEGEYAEWLGSRPRGAWDDKAWGIAAYLREGFQPR
jgi:hypothetical protein